MNEQGLWQLFFLTGLPEVYLALQGQAQEKEQNSRLALPAFAPEKQEGNMV